MTMKRGIAAFLLSAFVGSSIVSCGGPSRAGTMRTGPTRSYAPLSAKEDSKAANQAVILGTDGKGGSTLIDLPATGGKVQVDALWVRTGGGETPIGGTTPVKLEASPNTDGTVQVGVYEEFTGGAGSQWRAGVWIAAFVAATTLNKDLTDFRFSASSGGYIDGASASGMMTAGFLAALTGATIDPDATMTGTIDPDGTIGPVAGIPEKFTGAIARGKKRLGYPIGMRYSDSEATGKPVDLEALCKDQGATAVEIADIYDAYTFLTGKELPRPVAVPESAMNLDDATETALTEQYDEWIKMLENNWQKILELNSQGRLPSGLVALAKEAQDEAATAQKLKSQGLMGPAYARIVSAWTYVAAASSTYDILEKVQQGDSIGAIAALNELAALDQVTTAALQEIGEMKPTTLGGHLQMMSAFQYALTGWGFHVFAADRVDAAKQLLERSASLSAEARQLPENAEIVVDGVAPAVLAIGRAIAGTAEGTQAIKIEKETSINYRCSLPNVVRLSASFQSSASAVLAYFDELLLKPLAAGAGISEEEGRMRLAQNEPDYLVGYMASHLPTWDGIPAQLKANWGEKSLPWGIMLLSGTELAYFKTSLLIGKHYSLGVENDDDTGLPKSVEHDKAFSHMLAIAEQNARQNAQSARVAAGAIPIQAKLAYQRAIVLREGDIGDKLKALENFWQASMYSQTAVMLARN